MPAAPSAKDTAWEGWSTLSGVAVGFVLSGAVLVALALFLPMRPAVPEPGATAWMMMVFWMSLVGLWLVGLLVLAAASLRWRTALYRGNWCLLALQATVPVYWSGAYAEDALTGGAPSVAPVLFPIGFWGVLLGFVLLAMTGPGTRPLLSRPAAVAAGALLVGGVLAVFAWWIEIGSVAATTTDRAGPPVATPVGATSSPWEGPSYGDQRGRDQVTTNTGVVARLDDGIVAREGRTGQQRWHYRWIGAKTGDVAVSPSGDLVAVSFVSSVHYNITSDSEEYHATEGAKVVGLDAVTGRVRFTLVTDAYGVRRGLLGLTDHVLVSEDEGRGEPDLQGYDLRTGKKTWEYAIPPDCWPGATVAFKSRVVLTIRCPSEQSERPTLVALDDRTGEEFWRTEPPGPTSDGDVLRTDPAGTIVRLGNGHGSNASYSFDATTGRVLDDDSKR